MGIGPTFYGFMIGGILKDVVLCHILYLHSKMEFLNSCRAGQHKELIRICTALI